MIKTVEYAVNRFRIFFDVNYGSEDTFTYSPKCKSIERKTNRIAYTILFTNIGLQENKVLRIYGEKETVEKAFLHIKSHLKPFFSWSENGKRERLFLTVLGYILVAIIAEKFGKSYGQVMKTITEIREFGYSNSSHSHAEYSKEQGEFI